MVVDDNEIGVVSNATFGKVLAGAEVNAVLPQATLVLSAVNYSNTPLSVVHVEQMIISPSPGLPMGSTFECRFILSNATNGTLVVNNITQEVAVSGSDTVILSGKPEQGLNWSIGPKHTQFSRHMNRELFGKDNSVVVCL